MRVDSSSLQNNPAFRSISPTPPNSEQNTAAAKLNQIFSQNLDGVSTDTISDEMKAKLAELNNTQTYVSSSSEEAELTPAQKEAMQTLLKYTETLNNADKMHKEMMERLKGELEAATANRDKYQSMLDGKTSMSEFMQPAVSQEEYKKNPHTQTVHSADGTETVRTISYDDYKSVWDAQQTYVAREEVTSLLEKAQRRIDSHPERILIAEKCHNWRIAGAESSVRAALEVLAKEAKISAVTSSISKMMNQEDIDEESLAKLLEKMDELKEADPKNGSLFKEFEDFAKDWKAKHFSARA